MTQTTQSTEKAKSKARILEGKVASVKMNKTIVVEVIQITRHPLYRKTMRSSKRFFAHYEGTTLKEGDKVRIIETRPISKLKRFIVIE